MKWLFESQMLLLLVTSVATAQTPLAPAAAPPARPAVVSSGQAWQQPTVHPTFQLNLASNYQQPQFQIVDDRPAIALQEARLEPQPTPAVRTPTLARRPNLQAPVLADTNQPSQQLTFRGPPIQPAKPFIGWKFGQAAQSAAPSTPSESHTSYAHLVPQYTLHLADKPASDPAKTQIASSKPNPAALGLTGKFFSLQNRNRTTAGSSHSCPKCGRPKQPTAVAKANTGRKTR